VKALPLFFEKNLVPKEFGGSFLDLVLTGRKNEGWARGFSEELYALDKKKRILFQGKSDLKGIGYLFLKEWGSAGG